MVKENEYIFFNSFFFFFYIIESEIKIILYTESMSKLKVCALNSWITCAYI